MSNSEPVVQAVPIDAPVVSKAFWAQAWDRAVKTALQNLIVLLGAGTTVFDLDWQEALGAAAVTVVLSLLISLGTSRIYEVENFTIDLANRAVRTFAATFVGVLGAVDHFNVNEWKQAASLALTATLLSVLTSYVSRNIGTPGTASAIAAADLPTTTAVLVPSPVAPVSDTSPAIFEGTEFREE